MNLSLVDPFILAQDLPETLQATLKSGQATCVRFNHRGDLLASGRVDGRIVVFDVETNGIARKLNGHLRQVQSLSWSSNDRFLLSASQDCRAVLWDLKTGERLRTVRFEAPLFIAELHPKNHLVFVVAIFEAQPMLVDVSGEEPVKKPLPSAPRRSHVEGEVATEKQAAQDAKLTTTVATFSANGDHIIAGTNKGWLNIIDSNTCQTVLSSKLCSQLLILIRLSTSGRDMVVNSNDRIVRTFHLPDTSDPNLDFDTFQLNVEHKFQDLVNRLSWNHVAFSPTGEYVMASTYMNHDIYVWERGHGSLVKILEGGNEYAVVEWHPTRPFVAAVGVEGRIDIWSILTPQRWSALAPDFVEVEENVEYMERDDEFDIQPPEELHKRRLNLEDEEVDVLTIEPVRGLEFPSEQFRIPVLLDIDTSESEEEVVAIGTGQYRRKTPAQDWMNDKDAVPSGDDAKRPAKRGAQNGSRRKKAD